MSPFEKKRSNPYFGSDVAPDELGTEQDSDAVAIRMLRPLLLIQDTEEIDTLPVPPNSAYSYCRHSSLSPEAAVFKPSSDNARHDDEPETLLCATFADDKNTLETRRYLEEPVVRSFRNLSLQPDTHNGQARYQTLCNTTPQRSPRKDPSDGAGRRRRSNSLRT
jgi:hypothetical protein